MTGLEPQISGAVSNCSYNCATANAKSFLFPIFMNKGKSEKDATVSLCRSPNLKILFDFYLGILNSQQSKPKYASPTGILVAKLNFTIQLLICFVSKLEGLTCHYFDILVASWQQQQEQFEILKTGFIFETKKNFLHYCAVRPSAQKLCELIGGTSSS